MLKFRNLRPDEIEVRPTDTKGDKATLLLYKDARTDRRILDETVGPENWQCEFYEVNGATFCRVGIYFEDKDRWVWKSDCGTESNIEKEKGLASDAFKRACFKWGLGSELYDVPRIKISCPEKYYFNGKFAMTFYVKSFIIKDGELLDLKICDRFNKLVYSLNNSEVRYTETKASKREEEPVKEEKDEWLERLADFYREKKGEDFYAAWSFYRYWKGLIDNGQYPKSLKALWNKWLESPNRDKDEEEYKKWKKAKDEAKTLSDNE